MASNEVALTEKENPITKRGITEAQWRTLQDSLYPGARPASIVLVWDYCKARGLDPLKRACHIVPMEVKDARTGKYEWRDVVMPGIYELRTTAHRTGLYLGHSKLEYGPSIDFEGVEAPEWCEITLYRWSGAGREKSEFPVRAYFKEVVGTNKKGEVNARWRKAPRQMLEKCTEAKGLREAFPEEFGGQQTAEEMEGQRAIDAVTAEEFLPKTGTITLESLAPSEDPNRGHDNVMPDPEPVPAEEENQEVPEETRPFEDRKLNKAEVDTIKAIGKKKHLTEAGLVVWLQDEFRILGGLYEIPLSKYEEVCKKLVGSM